jgi:hypothetical protein
MPATRTATREDAPTAYLRLKRDIEAMLGLVAADVAAHASRAANNPRNWGYAGDLGEIRSRLMTCLVFFGNYQDEAEGRTEIEKKIAAHR